MSRHAGGRAFIPINVFVWLILAGLARMRFLFWFSIFWLAGWKSSAESHRHYGRGTSSCLQMARTVPSLISRWRGTLAILCNTGLNQYHGQHPRDTKRNHGAADGVPIPRVSCFRYFENLTHGLWGKAFFRKLALALQRQL